MPILCKRILQIHKFLRFASRGKAYQFWVILFRRALAPYKVHEHGSGPVAAPRCVYLKLPGRLENCGSIIGVRDKSSGHGTRSLEEFRAEHVASRTADNYSGSGSEFSRDAGTPASHTSSVVSGLPCQFRPG